MTTHHTPRTPAPSAVGNKQIDPAVDRTPIRFAAPRLPFFSSATRTVIRFIQSAVVQRRMALHQPAQASQPDSLYSALHQFNSPQRPR
ncbi:hypothetical protein [Pseudomonas sp.]|uniref:hypothetical protein n=1 Tax=Pseudomonas sp. TaxID=306 RepID=UPI003C784048